MINLEVEYKNSRWFEIISFAEWMRLYRQKKKISRLKLKIRSRSKRKKYYEHINGFKS